jgi:hypothetical protein
LTKIIFFYFFLNKDGFGDSKKANSIYSENKDLKIGVDRRKKFEMEKAKKFEDIKLDKEKLQLELAEESKRRDEDLKNKLYKYKKKKSEGQKKLQDFKEKKEETYKKERVEFIETKKELLKKKQDDIARMEKEEAEILKRLQATQALQEKAYEELGSAINLPSKDFSERYLGNNSVDSGGMRDSTEKKNKEVTSNEVQKEVKENEK